MVSALSRDISKITNNENKSVNVRLTGIFDCVGQQIKKTIFSPCALREFINSNADLPTIEELAEKSQTLARVMGMASSLR